MSDYPVKDIFENNDVTFPGDLGFSETKHTAVESEVVAEEEPVVVTTEAFTEAFTEAAIKQIEEQTRIDETTVAPIPESQEPAYSVVTKGSLSEDEYKIFHAAVEELDQAIVIATGDVETKLRKSKLRLLDILASKFGFPNASTVGKDGMSFNLKKNYEVELVRKRV